MLTATLIKQVNWYIRNTLSLIASDPLLLAGLPEQVLLCLFLLCLSDLIKTIIKALLVFDRCVVDGRN